LLEQRLKEMDSVGGPLLNMDFAMTGLGKDEGEPNTGQLPVCYSLVEMMTAEMLFQNARQLHLVEETE
jgi:hypothetical protein